MPRYTEEDLAKTLAENPALMVDMAATQRAADHIQLNRQANPATAIINDPVKVKKLRKAVGIGENKYHAVRTWSELCQRTFDSKAEARRGEDLFMLQKAREIEDLRYQTSFKLCEKPKITVTLDFTYLENGERIYEDVKGVLTRDSRTKYAWLEQKHRVAVRLIR